MAHRIDRTVIALVTLAILAAEWIWISPGLALTSAAALAILCAVIEWGRNPFRNWPNF